MEKITPAAAPLQSDSNDIRREPAEGSTGEVRSLSDYELWLVGGGDDIPGWNH
jgi:hypothetical protein